MVGKKSSNDKYRIYQITFRDENERDILLNSEDSYSVIAVGRSEEEAVGYAFFNMDDWKHSDDFGTPHPSATLVRELDVPDAGPEGLELVVQKKKK